jgi:uncharacterized protein YecE (DUF72 family)
MKILVGTSGYSYNAWKGKFYPARISPKEMLRFYAERLPAVEINNTFYRMPKDDVLRSWAAQVPGAFVFALKAPQIITHYKRLKDVDQEIDYFFRTISVLNQKLGPVLFQFPKSFKVDRPALDNFLGLVPVDISCAFEFRNPSWLTAGILDLLRSKGCSLCLADTDEDIIGEIISTASWGYLRLRRPDYTAADLAQWQERILAQEWQKVFVFFKHEQAGKGPEMALQFLDLTDLSRKSGN